MSQKQLDMTVSTALGRADRLLGTQARLPATHCEYKTQDINYIISTPASVLPLSYSAAEDGVVGQSNTS